MPRNKVLHRIEVAYSRSGIPGDVLINNVTIKAPLFGRVCIISFSGYCFGEQVAQAGGTAITYGFRAANPDEAGTEFGASRDGRIMFYDNGRPVEQNLSYPRMYGELLGFSDLRDGGVAAGRDVSRAILRKWESIVETMRQHIRKNLGKATFDLAISHLEKRFDASTELTIRNMLGSVNWGMLMSIDGVTMPACGEQALNIITFTMDNNIPRSHRLSFDGESEIEVCRNDAVVFDRQALADARATMLLGQVDYKLGEEFKRNGLITFKKNGYTFVAKPNKFVDCTDPNGKTAELCIHTVGLSCNPIDELIIAYLNVMHHFDEYMETAIYHRCQKGFMRPKKTRGWGEDFQDGGNV